MAYIHLNNISEIPQKGKVAVLVLVEDRAPCKKFMNETNGAIGELLEVTKAPTGGTYCILPWNDETRNNLTLRAMPTVIIYVDGKETKRFDGHWYSRFQIADLISEGFNTK